MNEPQPPSGADIWARIHGIVPAPKPAQPQPPNTADAKAKLDALLLDAVSRPMHDDASGRRARAVEISRLNSIVHGDAPAETTLSDAGKDAQARLAAFRRIPVDQDFLKAALLNDADPNHAFAVEEFHKTLVAAYGNEPAPQDPAQRALEEKLASEHERLRAEGKLTAPDPNDVTPPRRSGTAGWIYPS